MKIHNRFISAFATLLMIAASWMISGSAFAQMVDADRAQNHVRLEILFSEDMARRANGKSKGGHSNLKAGARFAYITDFYGEAPLLDLAKNLRSDLTEALSEKNIGIDPKSENVLWVTIVDAVPNEWTINQIKRLGVAGRATGIGGAAIVGQYYDKNSADKPLTIPHKYYSTEADDMARGWRDAERSISAFSKKTAHILAERMSE